MKKLLTLFLVISLLAFTGCGISGGTDDIEDNDEYVKVVGDEKSDKTENKGKKKEDKEDSEETERSAKIEEKWFGYLGCTPGDIKDEFGEMTESFWEDGPLYKYGTSDAIFAFSGYDFGEGSDYIPLGTCSAVIVPLGKLINNTDTFSADALEKALGVALHEEMDVMYEIPVFSASYNGYSLVMYADSRANISANTMVTIR